jgi:hypothetical protein
MRPDAVGIFCSYSHSDEELRSELFRHLELLRRSGIIRPWYDGAISAGQEWNAEIESALRSADVVLLLVSVDLLNSSYATKYELPIALERQGSGEALVIPVLLRPVVWSASGLDHLQALPDGLKPVVLWQPRDVAYVAVCEGLVKAVLVWRKGGPAQTREEKTEKIVRKRVLDVGLPHRVPVGLSTLLVVMIRRVESRGLAGLFNLESQYGIRSPEVQSTGKFNVTFPRASDGSLRPVEFEVVLETNDFEGTQTKALDVPPRGDSDLCVFLLTPRRHGPLVVNVELKHDGKRVAGSVLYTTGVPETPFEPAVQASIGVDIRDTPVSGRAPKITSIIGIAAALFVMVGTVGIWQWQKSPARNTWPKHNSSWGSRRPAKP